MAWLSGWNKRIELKIEDYAGDIGAEVTWFPVTVFLTATQCEEVFVELTTDAEFPKVAFTKADGETELYAECELFDVSEELGIYHVSRDGWTINANTSIYVYYDADHADNNAFIGAITARTEVWDGSFEAVYHMVDDNGNVDDSTSNNNDGTKKGAGEPAEAAGKVGQGQHFDADYINNATLLDVMPDDLTIEAIIKLDTLDYNWQRIAYKTNIENEDRVSLEVRNYNEIHFWGEAANGGAKTVISANTVIAGTWYYVAGVHTHSAALKVYLDTTEDTGDTLGTIQDGTFADIFIGATSASPNYALDGIMDELRFSSTPRTAAWLKGTYNTLWDSLLTYGSEERTFEYVGTGSLTFSGSGSYYCEISAWEYAGSGNLVFSGTGIYSIGFAYTGSGLLTYSGNAITTIGFAYAGGGELTYSGVAIVTIGFAYVGSGTYNFSGVGLYSLGLSYVGIGEFAYSGSATQVYTRCYLYAGSGLFTYSGEAVHRWGDWAEITKETSDFTEVDKGTSNWTKVNKEKGDWKKTIKL